MQLQRPDYKNSILNVTNSILKHYGAEHRYNTLSEVDTLLEKRYKHVVLMAMDGMGCSILENILPEDSFLRRHMRKKITSVFPPTTVAATTTLQSGLAPAEHGWLGWTMYFPEVDSNVTVFSNTKDDGTQAADFHMANTYQPYKKLGEKIKEASKVETYAVSQFGDYHIETFEELIEGVRELCNRKEQNYIYVYWAEPDHTMHETGCKSSEVYYWVNRINAELEELSQKLEDTLIIVTADHGHMNCKTVSITDYPTITECLERMPSLEPRALACYVKTGMEEQFEREFRKYFGDDFILCTKQEVIENKLFGEGKMHERFADAIGDYLAIAVSDTTIFNSVEERDFFKGSHAGLTDEEVMVPLIVIERK